MIYAKNYENIFKFVKVTHTILYPFFPGHGVFPDYWTYAMQYSILRYTNAIVIITTTTTTMVVVVVVVVVVW